MPPVELPFGDPERLGHGQFEAVVRVLQDDADPGPPVAAGAVRVVPHPYLAAVPAPVALEDLHGGGLAGPVRAEQAVGVQVDAVDGLPLLVALAQAPNPYRGHRAIVGLVRGSW
jgi:hypothetical protein